MTATTYDAASLDGIRSLALLLERLPDGPAARTLATKLGVWTTNMHDNPSARTQSPVSKFSDASDDQISDMNAMWNSEIFRVTQLLGLLEGQKDLLTLKSKAVRATAKSRVRTRLAKEADEAEAAAREQGQPYKREKPTATLIADEAESDGDVIAVDERMGILLVAISSTKAYKEACQAVAAGVSREISFRQAQYQARLR